MKQLQSFLLFLFISGLLLAQDCEMEIINARAQEQDPWVGTWSSENFVVDYNENTDENELGRYVLRITKSAEGYHVRVKEIKLNDPNWVYHKSAYTVTRVEGKTMYLRQIPIRKAVHFDPLEYADVTYYYKLSLKSDETLHYMYYRREYVDKNDKNITEQYTDGDGHDFFKDDW